MKGMRPGLKAVPRRRRARLLLALATVGAWASIPAASSALVQDPPPLEPVADGVAFRGDGMWIWYVEAEGRRPRADRARARTRGIETVFIKAGDGDDTWSQFTPELVGRVEARGLHVCAWQYVYGAPRGRGAASAPAAADEAPTAW